MSWPKMFCTLVPPWHCSYSSLCMKWSYSLYFSPSFSFSFSLSVCPSHFSPILPPSLPPLLFLQGPPLMPLTFSIISHKLNLIVPVSEHIQKLVNFIFYFKPIWVVLFSYLTSKCFKVVPGIYEYSISLRKIMYRYTSKEALV